VYQARENLTSDPAGPPRNLPRWSYYKKQQPIKISIKWSRCFFSFACDHIGACNYFLLKMNLYIMMYASDM